MSSFADPEIIALLKEKFSPATDDDWYNRRRKDAAGEFFRSVAAQGPREGSGTKQGHYILTPSGKLLGFNNNRALDRRWAFIRDALAKWDALPAAEKRPGAVKVEPLDAAKADRAKAERGFDVKTLGKIETDGKGNATRFDLVALGDHWGEGTYTRGARPGKNPLGIAFSLVPEKDRAGRVRPQASRWLKGYWEADLH